MMGGQTTFFFATLTVILIGLGQMGCDSGVLIRGLPAPQEQNQGIVGGQDFSGLPAVGALLNNGSLTCTGTLIEPRKVLTAGHCVEGARIPDLSFVLGSKVTNSQGQTTLKAADAYPHPGFNHSTIEDDIGLVILTHDAPVAPMGVVTSMDSSWVGEKLFFVGYGNSSSTGGSGTKRAVWMSIKNVNPKTFSYGGGGRNTCNGDSGGPAFHKDTNGNFLVAGITSYGDGNCSNFGVSTRVDMYMDFMDVSEDLVDPAQSACMGETVQGRCEEDTVIWCENNQIHKKDCAASGLKCFMDPLTKFFSCGELQQLPIDPEPDPEPDLCHGETAEGRCLGDTVIWCEDGTVHAKECDTAGDEECDWDSYQGRYDCLWSFDFGGYTG